jgi:hypothetical protein
MLELCFVKQMYDSIQKPSGQFICEEEDRGS